jgi:aminoglycoside 2'-N-acetyltransferase I
MHTEFIATEALSDAQRTTLEQMSRQAFPPAVTETLPGRFFSWDPPQWSVLVWAQGELATRVGLVVRDGWVDGMPKRIGGIGGVMTHPEKQGQGLAGHALREAARRLADELQVDFALLFCSPAMTGFYQRLQWQPFQGQVLIRQAQEKVEFTIYGAMVLDVREQAPITGVLDLNGSPW